MLGVVDGHVVVPQAQVLEAVVDLVAVRLDGRAGSDVLLDDGDDALLFPAVDDLQHDPAALLLRNDPQNPQNLAAFAFVVLPLAATGLVDLFRKGWVD
jgi:hypothetical protein